MIDELQPRMQEVMSWLVPCLSVDPASRPSVHDLLQQPFFLRLAAAEYLEAVSREEEQAEEEARLLGSGEAMSSPSATVSPGTRPSWLALALSRSFRKSSGGGSSSSSSGGLPPLKPRVPVEVSLPPSRGRGLCSDGYSHLDGDDERWRADDGDGYSHLDPDVIVEMEGLNMVVQRSL